MIRTPLRPLARILPARARGENPDLIERENIAQRHSDMEARARTRAEGRLLVLAAFFVCAYVAIGGRMAVMATSEPAEPVSVGGSAIANQRADIVDREGRILATNFETFSLYAQPPQMVDPLDAADKLVSIFPDLDRERLVKDFTGSRKFLWIKKKISPEQMQAVHDIGDPGLMFGPREMRLYPNGKLASHVLGGASFGKEGVNAAEVIGVAGVEKQFDDYLRDPANGGKPLALSLDLSIQDATEEVLYGGMKLMNAKGATSILMDVYTGEVISVASLPDFDPNERPRPPTSGFDPSESPLFNRAVQGVYELGSTFKIFTAAQAMELGLVNPDTIIDIRGPLRWGKFSIRDFSNYGKELSVTRIIEKSSNIGTARLAQQIGTERQRAFLDRLGMLKATPFEIVEASGGQPLLPKNWSELSTMTISYGHGISTTPMHLAAGYAALANGGRLVQPTILKQNGPQMGERIVSEDVARASLDMLRGVVSSGTASMADVSGYSVGGKTGSADKPKPMGGYYKDKVIATFAAVFPTDEPKYVLIVTLDEPEIIALDKDRRTAGWTAAPVAGEMIARLAPLLGLRPQIEPAPVTGVTLTSN
ncbi:MULTISPECIES: peptidoglycan D,D-transpeptidase FtsI family protein [Tritonibacter]|uniref:peptidoglycan D,D-transpeptidase FtsI family protein n=1 Tax=Tritonibacter TaxID=2083206 RepID=UPI000806A022|nr:MULTISPECIES: penicillin-binding protein 2 [Tritonibacter]MBU3034813.1 penicillin-binding protein 2 [Tritonibacter mobilis]MCA2008754.1 penicillin-binding protein 2 [Tritonibacter mobilis]WHQ83295.1 penicillin-binding protein 2 [Tritonibacter mobilis]SDW66303.1 cell division protein FtsI (penicillin-binding protein 3) [Tritonibacter mobilis]GLP85588.1 cell division protein FtsI [Tritonibacter mobilis]